MIDWTRFRRRNLNFEVDVEGRGCVGFACGDEAQAVVWLLRVDRLDRKGRVRADAEPVAATVAIPGLGAGRYRVTPWDTVEGQCLGCFEAVHTGEGSWRFRCRRCGRISRSPCAASSPDICLLIDSARERTEREIP